MYEQHHVCSSAFGGTGTGTRRTSGGGTQPASLQARYGCHTFRRGDVVAYTATHEGDPSYSAAVFGVLMTGKKENEQGRKLLVLYDQKVRHFPLGQWTEWSHEHTSSMTMNIEDNSTAKTMTANEYLEMTKKTDACIISYLDRSIHSAQLGPRATPGSQRGSSSSKKGGTSSEAARAQGGRAQEGGRAQDEGDRRGAQEGGEVQEGGGAQESKEAVDERKWRYEAEATRKEKDRVEQLAVEQSKQVGDTRLEEDRPMTAAVEEAARNRKRDFDPRSNSALTGIDGASDFLNDNSSFIDLADGLLAREHTPLPRASFRRDDARESASRAS
eukprot:6214721-Pleurochrysis_carterae.AAC.1